MSKDESAAPLTDDEKRLHQLGYAQELSRTMSGFSNFAVSFTIISILSGCLTLYGFGMNTGGPAMIVWGWPFVGLMTLFVGLAMAEVCSSYPDRRRAVLLVRQTRAAQRRGLVLVHRLVQLPRPGRGHRRHRLRRRVLPERLPRPAVRLQSTPGHTILLFGIILLVHGLLNSFGVKLVAKLNDISVWWHVVGVVFIVGALVFVPDKHQSAGFVFGHFVNNTGWGSTFYVALLGLLLAQYTFTGYDASAHMTEETHDAARSGPRGIVMSILVSLAAGLGAADRPDVRDPELRRRPRAARPAYRRRRSSSTRSARRTGQGPAAGRDRRAAVLRDVVGDRELADDLRVLP